VLLLPPAAFPRPSEALREELARSWTAGPVVEVLPPALDSELVLMLSQEPPGACAERLVALAADPRLAGKLLGGWCLAGALRPDVPASIVARGGLAGLGMASSDFVDVRRAPRLLASYAGALRSPLHATSRVEGIDGPFLWYF
jgi:hypothetical protein